MITSKKHTDMFLLEQFGFANLYDLVNSLLKMKGLLATIILSSGFGVIAELFEEYMGIAPMVYLAIMGLFILEFWTGIKASLKRGEKIVSRKFGRIGVKIAFWTIVLGIIQALRMHLGGVSILGESINWYSWIYYTILNIIVFQNLISVLENWVAMGNPETEPILKFVKYLFNRWLDFKESEVKK